LSLISFNCSLVSFIKNFIESVKNLLFMYFGLSTSILYQENRNLYKILA